VTKRPGEKRAGPGICIVYIVRKSAKGVAG
jgi:hypothetical protein